MIAAGRAAKDKGPLPPQLWKVQNAALPGWSEFDRISYREYITATTLHNIYTVVEMWKSGQATKNPEAMKYYARLVGDGIVGKNV